MVPGGGERLVAPAPRASIRIAGHPAPKGSRTFLGKGRSRESSERCGPWVETVAYAARANRPGGKVLEPPYKIELVFSMPEGQKPKWAWPTKDGDGDKLERAIFDALKIGGLIVDDRHVIACTWRKQFGVPSVRVLIH